MCVYVRVSVPTSCQCGIRHKHYFFALRLSSSPSPFCHLTHSHVQHFTARSKRHFWNSIDTSKLCSSMFTYFLLINLSRKLCDLLKKFQKFLGNLPKCSMIWKKTEKSFVQFLELKSEKQRKKDELIYRQSTDS